MSASGAGRGVVGLGFGRDRGVGDEHRGGAAAGGADLVLPDRAAGPIDDLDGYGATECAGCRGASGRAYNESTSMVQIDEGDIVYVAALFVYEQSLTAFISGATGRNRVLTGRITA
jgi:hypothetical protein